MKKFLKIAAVCIAIVVIIALLGGGYLIREFKQIAINGGYMVEWNTEDGEVLRDLKYGPSYRNTYDLYLPANKKPSALMLFIHGGSWTHGQKEDMEWAAKRYAKQGYITASINYSRLRTDSITGPSKYPYPCLQSMLEEIDASIAAIKTKCNELGCNLKQMSIGGYSAGGHLSMLYASRYAEKSALPIKFQISWVGPSDFNLLFPTPDIETVAEGQSAEQIEHYKSQTAQFMYALAGRVPSQEESSAEGIRHLKSEVSPADLVHKKTPPAVLAYGGNDKLVNAIHGQRMAQELEKEGIEHHLIIFPNSGHELGKDPECSDSLHNTILKFCEKFF